MVRAQELSITIKNNNINNKKDEAICQRISSLPLKIIINKKMKPSISDSFITIKNHNK